MNIPSNNRIFLVTIQCLPSESGINKWGILRLTYLILIQFDTAFSNFNNMLIYKIKQGTDNKLLSNKNPDIKIEMPSFKLFSVVRKIIASWDSKYLLYMV